VFLPAILSGLLLWTAYFPLDLGPVAFVALVPWLSLVRAEGVSPHRRYLAAYVGGLAFFLPALQWIRVAHPAMYASWIGLALYCSLYHVAALFMLRRLDRLGQPPLAFTVPVVWVALEYVRAHLPTGFPFLAPVGAYQLVGFAWYFLGHALHGMIPLIQVADLGGVYLLTALVAAVNGTVFEWLVRFNGVRKLLRWPYDYRPGFYREMWEATAVVALLLTFFIYGMNRLQHPPFEKGPRVTAIQADIPQDAKMTDTTTLFRRYDNLSRTAASRADLVVWPETCFPFPYFTVARGIDLDAVPQEFQKDITISRENLAVAAEGWRTNVLLGLTAYEWDGRDEWRYNAALLIDAAGNPGPRYDKIHLVPFGEYVPFKRTFPWLQTFTPYTHDYSCRPGETYTRFPLHVGNRTFLFGCLICYEDSDPYLARQYVRPGLADPVDFLVNLSNDGWFRGTEQHEQHLAICRFRAVEARRTVVRAVNMGISAIIDPDGRVVALPGDSWADSKRMDGTVTDRLPLDTRQSFYARFGDWFPALSWAVIVVGLVLTRRRRSADG
jgi:apolipoprotein N-acyltransferase